VITIEQLAGMVPCSIVTASIWYTPLLVAMSRWEISHTPERTAGFIAQISHESARLTRFEENLDYSADGLARTWPNRYSINPRATKKLPNDLAFRIARRPELIANYTYANRLGNGGFESGDGWRYRGRGPIQITGYDNYKECGRVLGCPLVFEPELLLIVDYGADAAAWYWYARGCNQAMDRGDYEEVTRLINGALIGYEDRLAALETAKTAIGLA
jgi:putative chitinase